MINGIVLIKSRGSFLALVLCVAVAVVLGSKGVWKKALPYLFLGLIGGFMLLDPGYLDRMSTLETTEVQGLDEAATSRLHFWNIALQMSVDYPLGVGEGNFGHYIQKQDGKTGVGHVGCDQGPHGAGADDPHFVESVRHVKPRANVRGYTIY